MTQIFPTNFPPSNAPIIDDKGAMSILGMAFFRALYNRTGQGNGLVNQVDTAAVGGDTLTDDWNLITSGTGTCTLPSLTGGQMIVVQNNSGGGILIAAPSGSTIDGSANYSLASTKMQIFWYFTSALIFSTQLG